MGFIIVEIYVFVISLILVIIFQIWICIDVQIAIQLRELRIIDVLISIELGIM